MPNVPSPPIDLTDVRQVYWQCPHQHVEAFALMFYQSKDGQVHEWLWNSRDGVTPFGITSRDESAELFHEYWNRDIYCPKYRPAIGMRVFVDLTPEIAREGAVKYVNKWWEGKEVGTGKGGIPAMSSHCNSKEQAIEEMIRSWTEQPGQPHVITVDEAWLQTLKEGAAN